MVQTGDPEGPDDGFRDPKTDSIRTVPLEIRVEGDKAPIYDFSLEVRGAGGKLFHKTTSIGQLNV